MNATGNLDNLSRFEAKIPLGWLLFIALSTLGIFMVDLRTPVGVATWLFYLVPLAVTYFLSRPVAPLAVAALATLLVIVDYFISPDGISPWISQLNRTIGIAMLWCGAVLLHKIIVSRLELQERAWYRAAQSQLSQQVIGELSVEQASGRILTFLAGYLKAPIGALYAIEEDGSLRRTAAVGVAADHPTRIARGEGLLSQCLIAKQARQLKNLPSGYLRVNSALGGAASTTVLMAPLFAEDRPVGAIELGFLGETYPSDQTLIELLSESIGIVMRTAQLRGEREALLRATQVQAEELQTQQEELRVANEELEQQGDMLRDSQVRLETQQAELEQTNVQLEEHTQLLSKQNDALEAARGQLIAKALELERSNQFKSEFLANMSHELRTPLNSSLILAKLLGDNPTGNLTEEQVKFARNIYSAGNDLLELINDILDLSKIEARKIDVTRESISLLQLVDSLDQTFDPIAAEKGVEFQSVIEPGVPELIHSDSQRLRQVLKNLLSNAIKFTPAGAVKLRVFVPPVETFGAEFIAFEVIDTGIGIAPEQHEMIFQPFRQADGTTNRRFGGTGLGLSISRELASLLGGRIELQSTPGVGSTFTFAVPLDMPAREQSEDAPRIVPRQVRARRAAHRQERAANAVPVAHAGQSAGSGRTLLVIEDDVSFATMLCDLAKSLHYDCIHAMTADEGVELALQYRPTAIMLDIHLPDHTGLTVLDRLKHNPATRHIPVQVISGFDYSQAALQMGAANVMLKPVDRDRLIDALSNLGRKAASAERAVLIVEDNTIQRDSIQQLLKSESVRVAAVASAAAALEQLRTTTFDCMVLDLALPDANGFELLEKMATDDTYSFPPVIVYTARAISTEEEQQLRRYSKSIIIKGAKSPERLLDEVTLFLHKVEESLPPEHQRLLRKARSRDSVFEGRRILLVEDDVRNVFAVSRVLEPHGAKLEIARNGKEALTTLAQQADIELVLMDIMMPEMDGLQAMQEIRKQKKFDQLPIIALTAKAMPDDRQRSLDAGANDYITKPIDIDKLLSLVRIWLPTRPGALA
jgi:signal transduction histidine kinase/DNA-binding response OmpR family regulator